MKKIILFTIIALLGTNLCNARGGRGGGGFHGGGGYHGHAGEYRGYHGHDWNRGWHRDDWTGAGFYPWLGTAAVAGAVAADNVYDNGYYDYDNDFYEDED